VIQQRVRTSLLIALLVALTACSTTPNADQATLITIRASDLPIQVTAAQVSSERIIALANGSAEVVYSLGFGTALVGRDIASTFPGDYGVPVVTSAHSVSAEKVLAQRPTLVIVDARSGPREALKQIESAGVRIASIPEAWTLSDVAPRIRAIGQLLNAETAALALVAQAESDLAKVQKSVAGTPVAFLYLRGTASVYLLGGEGSGADSLLNAIGAVDVGARAKLAAFTPLNSEALIAAKPEVLLVMRKGLESVGGVEGLVKLPGVAQTPAGAARRVIAVDDEVMLAFGGRTPALVKALSEALQTVTR
jgi:iron complex transport system substrate-binding protein